MHELEGSRAEAGRNQRHARLAAAVADLAEVSTQAERRSRRGEAVHGH